MAALSIFLDTSVVIDLLLQRPAELNAIVGLFNAARNKTLNLCVSESVVCTAIYVCKKSRDASAMEAFLQYASVLSVEKGMIITALKSSFSDKEDAILYHLALHHKMEYFITRNKKDFRNFAQSGLPVLSPKEFIKKIA